MILPVRLDTVAAALDSPRSVRHSFPMRFTREQLISKALQALEEVHDQAQDKAVPKSLQLRFLLASLGAHMPERWPVDRFWQTVTEAPYGVDADRFGRKQSITNAIAGVYHQLGFKRER